VRKKYWILVISIIVVGLIISGIIIFYKSSQIVGPCEGYAVVGEFEDKIYSKADAITIVKGFFSSIGYELELTDFDAGKGKKGWDVRLNSQKFYDLGVEYCHYSANPPECLSTDFRLKESLFGKNQILMRYLIPC